MNINNGKSYPLALKNIQQSKHMWARNRKEKQIINKIENSIRSINHDIKVYELIVKAI